MLNIDIDTGGTMTDGLVSGDGPAGSVGVFSVKVETTPHDVTLAFMEVLDAARERVGAATLRDLLDNVALIRWSSTITSNVLAQKTGPRLGLLVTAGHEDDLYAGAGEAASVVDVLVPRENITGISHDADDDEVRRAVKGLFDKGIRRINISLKGAFEDNSAERKIVAMIDAQYPDHYLGSIPALPASEILLRPDDATRTFVSLINAYVHPSLATTLYRAEETLKQQHSWRGNVLVGHINGGVARIGKTTAFDTIESGPLFGTHACAHEAARHGDARVLAIDVGGTTAKVSAVDAGRVVDREEGNLFGIPLRMNLPLLRSIALGGGSVARASRNEGDTAGQVTLGPDSMGAAPGPACYGLGGRNATTTDAFVLLGYLAPDAFLDGRRTLDVAAAREAIERTVGTPLGISAEDAARKIVDRAYEMVAKLARETAAEMGWQTADTSVYAFGGNGPLVATGVAGLLGASTVRLFGLGHVLSAYGSAISDVVHVYESAISSNDTVNSDDAARAAAGKLADEARRDLAGEGFDAEAATLRFEVRTTDGARSTSEGTIDGALNGAARSAGGARIDTAASLVRLTARSALPGLVTIAPAADAAAGTTGESGIDARSAVATRGIDARSAVATRGIDARSAVATRGGIPTSAWSAAPGSTVPGPALIDGGSFTWLVGEGWTLAVDGSGDAVATRGGKA